MRLAPCPCMVMVALGYGEPPQVVFAGWRTADGGRSACLACLAGGVTLYGTYLSYVGCSVQSVYDAGQCMCKVSIVFRLVRSRSFRQACM